MRALVVYESMYGNTRQVAQAVAEGLGAKAHVDVVEVGDAATHLAGDLDLLVIGAPTHAFGMSHPNTREDAARKAPAALAPSRTGLREWLDQLDQTATVAAATFDTRFAKPRWLTGSAARGAAKRLRRHHCRLVTAPESFFVTGTAGPLVDGELDRARAWGATVAAAAGG